MPHDDAQGLTAYLRVRVTPEEKARLQEDADVAGLSVSELVRRRYFGKPILASTDRAMIRELRRIGGLLKHIHNQSDGVYSKETAQALVAIKAYIEHLSHDRQKGKGEPEDAKEQGGPYPGFDGLSGEGGGREG